MESAYVSGVCNIGPAEIRRRRTIGWIGTALTTVVWIGLIVSNAASAWHLVLWLPAIIAATGFVQARLKFCANYGMRNMFNFGALGSADLVQDVAARRRDRARSWQIVGMAAMIATGVTIVGTLTA